MLYLLEVMAAFPHADYAREYITDLDDERSVFAGHGAVPCRDGE